MNKEDIIREYIDGFAKVPMSTELRKELIKEVNRVEGFDNTVNEHTSDEELARQVLRSWAEIARDKGLY